MKKLVLGLMLLTGSAYAACVGTLCYDDVSSQIMTGLFLSGDTIANLGTVTPVAKGMLVYCNNCTQTLICVSTGTTRGGWGAVAASTSTTSGFGQCR